MTYPQVITQGDQGDFFYIVASGSFDVYIHPSGSFQSGPDGLGKKVATIPAGGTFGELALMYGAPRNATVVSASDDCTLWALDRVTFRRILMGEAFRKRKLYEGFLKEVELLKDLDDYERSKIADALESVSFGPGETIIKEGEAGDAFYLLESGEAEAYKEGLEGAVAQYKKGDYFGELALLNSAPRAATVKAKEGSEGIKVARLGREGFQRLLGPVEGIMRRRVYSGADEGVDPLTKA
jgi:cAMP-dependent protein kinase regulator